MIAIGEKAHETINSLIFQSNSNCSYQLHVDYTVSTLIKCINQACFCLQTSNNHTKYSSSNMHLYLINFNYLCKAEV